MCTFVQVFPMVESVYAIEGGEVGAELVHSLCNAKPTLRLVNVRSGSLRFEWAADEVGAIYDYSNR
jgi:hypothetical protein